MPYDFYSDFYYIAKVQATKLLKAEVEYPNKEILLKLRQYMIDDISNCPVHALEIPHEEIEKYAQKAWAYSNYFWYRSKLSPEKQDRLRRWFMQRLSDALLII